MPIYLKTKIVESKRTNIPRYGMTIDGYTQINGAPTSIMVCLDGEKRWRRVMCWQFSNIGTCFVRIKGKEYIVRDYQIPKPGSMEN